MQSIPGSLQKQTSKTGKRPSLKDEGSKPSNVTLGMKGERLSNQERRVDALALRAEERRDKLRKAAGSCT